MNFDWILSMESEYKYSLTNYKPYSYDETRTGDGCLTEVYKIYDAWLSKQTSFDAKNKLADLIFRRIGITFAVYGEQSGVERLIPFDPIPRILSSSEWEKINAGVCQRVKALNAFLNDIYTSKKILKENIIPSDLILQNSEYTRAVENFIPPNNVHTHISGIDIIRTSPDTFYVLEDNLRCPSGVSYMLENREVMSRLFPELFKKYNILPINHYPHELKKTLKASAPNELDNPRIVVLTPGIYNSAYFEHAFLAAQMGVDLVTGADLFVGKDNCVYMQTIDGAERVDVIYRRIDDNFLDPEAFNPNSVLGCPGLYRSAMQGKVTICNAIGNGVADDKAVYPYVPKMIEFYLEEKPILENVKTYTLSKKDDCTYVLEHLSELVVKETHGSGGYGMLIGPKATKSELEEFRTKIKAKPSNYIAQPTLSLSTSPTLQEEGLAPRHVDLRPYALMQSPDKVTVVPGSLTRVALKQGSLVVNSSQGGGTKDTWIVGNQENTHA